MQKERDEETRPYVIAYFDVPHGETWADLTIKNVGKTAAKNVKMTFDPQLQNTAGSDLMNLPMIQDGIPMLPPGYEVKTTFEISTTRYYKTELPLSYNVDISYSGGMGDKERTTNCVVDLSVFKGLTYIERKDLHDLVAKVEELTKEIKDSRR